MGGGERLEREREGGWEGGWEAGREGGWEGESGAMMFYAIERFKA